jgi:hypothetical protein
MRTRFSMRGIRFSGGSWQHYKTSRIFVSHKRRVIPSLLKRLLGSQDDRIDERRMIWYAHVREMKNHRLLHQALGLSPVGRTKGV